MAKTTAPLLSFDAGGAIAKSMVFARWRGVPYVRRYVVPSNPNSTSQTTTRTLFRNLNTIWSLMTSLGRDPWDANAVGRPYLGRNKFIGENIQSMRPPDPAPPPTDYSEFVGSPGARGGPPPSGIVVTPAATTATVDFTVPTAPTGWTLTAAQVLVLSDLDPADPYTGIVAAFEDVAAPWTVAVTGLVTATNYVVAGWLEWTKPDGSLAYSVSITASFTTA